MTKVLIVSKTRMKSGLCVGGLTLENDESVRLLTKEGNNQPIDAPYNIGDIWELEMYKRSNLVPPHVEDVLVSQKEYMNTIANLREYLQNHNIRIAPLNPQELFDGLVGFTSGNKPYICKRLGFPNYSTGFWKTDSLYLEHNDNKPYYCLQNYDFKAPYVGFIPPIEVIPAKTLVRVSLPRGWPTDGSSEERCYVQISGWYL